MSTWLRFRSSILLFCLLSGWNQGVDISAEYIIYSHENGYIRGAGKVVLTAGDYSVSGSVLMLDIRSMAGKIMGSAQLTPPGGKPVENDEVLFRLFPFRYLGRSYTRSIEYQGDRSLDHPLRGVELEELKKSSLYYECRSLTIKPTGQIVARHIIPYLLQVPSLPLKKFIIRKGEMTGRTVFFLENIDYTRQYGLSANLGFNLHRPVLQGEHRLKLFERGLFGSDGTPRGFIFQARDSLVQKNRDKPLVLDSLFNTDQGSYNLTLTHQSHFSGFHYTLAHNLSGRQGTRSYHLLTAGLSYRGWEKITPRLDFSTDYHSSRTYRISAPIQIIKSLRIHPGWERNVTGREIRRDDTRFFTRLDFSSSLVSFHSNLDITRDLVELTSRSAFSLQMGIPPVKFLQNRIRFVMAPFYTFTAFPGASGFTRTSTPGIQFSIASEGIGLPLGTILIPRFGLYHLWNGPESTKTNFDTQLSVEKKLGNFSVSLDYSLVSRFDPRDFWVQGYSMNHLSLRCELKKDPLYSLSSRVIFNDDFNPESITFLGRLSLPWQARLFASTVYQVRETRLATMEIYLQKDFIGLFKLRGGYSLSLKRFFIDLVQSL